MRILRKFVENNGRALARYAGVSVLMYAATGFSFEAINLRDASISNLFGFYLAVYIIDFVINRIVVFRTTTCSAFPRFIIITLGSVGLLSVLTRALAQVNIPTVIIPAVASLLLLPVRFTVYKNWVYVPHVESVSSHQRRDEMSFEYHRLSILIPMFNESASATHVVRSVREHYPDAEIIVCDDGSEDETLSVLKGLAVDTDFRIVGHETNSGYGCAWKTLTVSASREFGVFFDGDGQFNVADIGRVYDELRRSGAAMVSGERSSDDASPFRRRPGKLVLRLFTRLMSGQAIRDFNCGLRAVHIEQLRRYLPLLPDGFSASTTSLLSYLGAKERVSFVPINVVPRSFGKSSVSITRDGARTLALIAKVTMLFGPLRVFTPLATTLVLIGAFYGISEAVEEGIGFPVLASLTIVNGVVIGSVGLLADQIAHLRRLALGLG